MLNPLSKPPGKSITKPKPHTVALTFGKDGEHRTAKAALMLTDIFVLKLSLEFSFQYYFFYPFLSRCLREKNLDR